MERKTKNTTKKQTKKVVKKQTIKKETKINSKKKKGFTLIELLAVIIILGILMIIAIPSVTKYINDSRKNTYIDTAKELVGGARNVVNEGKLEMYSTNTTYYIPSKCIKTENGGEAESPYGKFKQAYIGVIYNGQGYKYYWISVDDSGQGIKDITPLDKLDVDLIESDLKASDVEDIVNNTGIGNRSEIYILDCQSNEWETQRHLDDTSNNASEEDGGGSSSGGSSSNAVVYPEGKTKDTVVTGDIVTIDTEEFYVVKHDGSDLVLLSHYNLNVGSKKKATATEGIQDSEVKGWASSGTKYGTIAFSSTNYWDGKVGTDYPGNYCTSSSGTNCVYVYDSNSNLKTYVDSYKTYLEGKGATIKSARLMTLEESYAFKNENQAAWKETSYWLGSTYDALNVWLVDSSGSFGGNRYDDDYYFGVRPVIVI